MNCRSYCSTVFHVSMLSSYRSSAYCDRASAIASAYAVRENTVSVPVELSATTRSVPSSASADALGNVPFCPVLRAPQTYSRSPSSS